MKWDQKIMNEFSILNTPFLLGFEEIEQAIDKITKKHDGYPPYDIEQINDNGFKIVIAVAGFNEDELDISMEDNQLKITGKKQSEDDGEKIYIHKGIATRHFVKTFILADGIEVLDAEYNNGLLSIKLIKPAAKCEIKRIKINSKSKQNILSK